MLPLALLLLLPLLLLLLPLLLILLLVALLLLPLLVLLVLLLPLLLPQVGHDPLVPLAAWPAVLAVLPLLLRAPPVAVGDVQGVTAALVAE